jgi:hypothetical protein
MLFLGWKFETSSLGRTQKNPVPLIQRIFVGKNVPKLPDFKDFFLPSEIAIFGQLDCSKLPKYS